MHVWSAGMGITISWNLIESQHVKVRWQAQGGRRTCLLDAGCYEAPQHVKRVSIWMNTEWCSILASHSQEPKVVHSNHRGLLAGTSWTHNRNLSIAKMCTRYRTEQYHFPVLLPIQRHTVVIRLIMKANNSLPF